MAEQTCPTCGKLNPAGLEACQFCGAQLDPSNIHPDRPAEAPGAAEADLEEAGDEAAGQAASSGPLFGLAGILPADPELSRSKRAPAYTARLQVAEAQQTRARILEELIKEEGEAPPKPSRAGLSSAHIFRLLIFLALLAAALWPALDRSQNTSLPAFSSEIYDASRAVGALPAGAAVLLAVDFEPGFTGEMEAAAGAVVDHLMLKGAFLALVSTTPTGPLQAERLVSAANLMGRHNYTSPGQYTNLGFIPGGASGLLGFAGAPRQVLPYALEADLAWSGGALEGVQALSDLALVVVLTDNPATARAWIEQVQPALDGTPLIVVSSAQAGPLIRPYYAGLPQQVDGLVMGLAGGAAYEGLMAREGAARQAWDAYSFLLPLAGGLILLGALAGLFASLFSGSTGAARSG